MCSPTGDDLINKLTELNVDIGNLSPNVIKAWFDTDCKHTKDILNWMCTSLMNDNYVPPLEKQEFENIEEQLDSNKCAEELAKLNPNYLSMLDDGKHLGEILLLEDEVDLLEEENTNLDQLIKIYENVDSSISLDLTHRVQREIQSKSECKKQQQTCEILCKSLDEFNKNMHETLVKYDPESHIVKFVNVKGYYENIGNLNSLLVPLMEIDKTILDQSDELFSEELETCRKRILHSHQIYLANKVETEKLQEILIFLKETNINECIPSWNSLNNNANLEAKELYKKRMCDVLDSIASRLADHYLKQTKIRYVERELEEFQQKSENISKILESITKCLAYYAVTNFLLFEEKKDVDCINNFYQKMITHVDKDLHRCRARTEQMNRIIEDYKIYLARPVHERSKLISSIAKVLSSEDYSLKSIADAVGKFKSELSFLESQFFSIDFEDQKQKMTNVYENIRILESFLISGPTNSVVLIPLDLQKMWFEIEEHLKKESDSIARAVQIPQDVRKRMTKAQDFTKQLWMTFLTNPSKIDSILKQAEDYFQKRTEQYF